MELNLEQYTREFLNRKDVLAKLTAGAPESTLTEDEKLLLNFQTVPSYYSYKLCGVVLHSGTADAGHYISVAVDRESEGLQWYEFNDARVARFNPDLMEVEAFGTSEKGSKATCGYMLVYERSNFFHMPTVRELFEKASEIKDPEKIRIGFENAQINYNSLESAKLSESDVKHLVSENAKSRQTKLVLNFEYIDTINTLLTYITNFPPEESKLVKGIDTQIVPFAEGNPNKELEELQFLAIYVLTVMLRITLRAEYYDFLEAMVKGAKRHSGFSVWLLETFVRPEIVQEFMVTCPVSKARFLVASLLTVAFNKVYEMEEGRVAKYIENPTLFGEKIAKKAELKLVGETNKQEEVYYLPYPKKGLPYCLLFLHNLMANMSKLLDNRRPIFEYFFLISTLCRAHPVLIKFLLRYELLGAALEILLENLGASTETLKSHKLIILKKELNLGFQKTEPESNDLGKKLYTVSLVYNKHYRFVVELLSQVRCC